MSKWSKVCEKEKPGRRADRAAGGGGGTVWAGEGLLIEYPYEYDGDGRKTGGELWESCWTNWLKILSPETLVYMSFSIFAVVAL